jgi:hypothetical protein
MSSEALPPFRHPSRAGVQLVGDLLVSLSFVRQVK